MFLKDEPFNEDGSLHIAWKSQQKHGDACMDVNFIRVLLSIPILNYFAIAKFFVFFRSQENTIYRVHSIDANASFSSASILRN
jgi:hypothetical protein